MISMEMALDVVRRVPCIDSKDETSFVIAQVLIFLFCKVENQE